MIRSFIFIACLVSSFMIVCQNQQEKKYTLEECIQIALENNLSETAFLVKQEASRYEIRWFSPLSEIQFCGHATLAAAFVLLAVAGLRFVNGGEVVELSVPWVPYLNLDFVLRLGGVGLLMGLLITGIGALILLYASSYMHGNSLANRLYAYLYGFMFAMTGLVLADHLLLLFGF